MLSEDIMAIATWAAVAAAALGALADWLHARRVRRLSRLAFGPDSRPRVWTKITPLLRTVALAGIVWSLVVLMAFEGSSRSRERKAAAPTVR